MAGPIFLRLSKQTEWVNDIPLKFLWTIALLPRDNQSMTDLAKNISSIVKRYEGDSKWPVSQDVYNKQADDAYGYMFASSVGFPSDAYNISNSITTNYGGYLPGPIGGERNGYGGSNALSINFLETNVDIIDNLIRPWIIAASHKGLIEDGKEDIKCNIAINMYTKDAHTQNVDPLATSITAKFQRRKSFIFEDAVPFQVSGDEISYGELSISDITKSVSFAFSKYYTTLVNDR